MAEPSPLPTTITVEPTVTVTTTVDDPGRMLLFGQDVDALAAFIVGMLLVLAITVVLVRALVTAGKLPPPVALVTALSVLTMLSIAGGIFGDSDEAWTIAAAGIGALAGSVTAVFREPPHPPPPPKEEEP